jgi:hypothetical protein
MNRDPNRQRARQGDVVARVAVVLGLVAVAGILAAGEPPASDSLMAGLCDPAAKPMSRATLSL